MITLEVMICNWRAGEIDSTRLTLDPTCRWSGGSGACGSIDAGASSGVLCRLERRCLYSVTGQELHVAWPTERDPAAAAPSLQGKKLWTLGNISGDALFECTA